MSNLYSVINLEDAGFFSALADAPYQANSMDPDAITWGLSNTDPVVQSAALALKNGGWIDDTQSARS